MDNLWEKWEEVLKTVRENLRNERSYETWFKPIKPAKLEDGCLFLEIPNPLFFKGLLPFVDNLRASLDTIFGNAPELRWVYPSAVREVKTTLFGEQLNPEYTFETLVRGHCNQLAHAAGNAIAQSPGIAYNPFFVYGGVGLGKTHLIQAIGNLSMKKSGCTVALFPCEIFVNLFIQSIQKNTIQLFRNKLRSVDILLIDDIHFIAGKEGSQEEFFNTFNTLYDKKKQIILTSDRPPKELFSMEKRLVSRFEWGLVADLQPPDFETRVAILKKKCEAKNFTLGDDVVFYIAENITDNIRLLEGSLNRLVAISSLLNRTLDINIAKDYLKEMIASQKKNINIENIQERVAKYFNISLLDLKSSRRLKNLVVPRQIAMYLSRSLTDTSLTAIAEEFGGKDHTTVLYACKKIKNLIENDNYMKTAVDKIIHSIKG